MVVSVMLIIAAIDWWDDVGILMVVHIQATVGGVLASFIILLSKLKSQHLKIEK